MQKILLSTAYLPNLQYIKVLASNKVVYLEKFENFSKQTFRSRAQILSSQGVENLNIPIVKANSKHLICNTKISNQDPWQNKHWNAIVSYYNSSAYFEYYKDDFVEFYNKKYDNLFDYNLMIINKICEILEIKTQIIPTEDFIKINDENYLDLRNIIHPKVEQKLGENYYSENPYYQVFGNQFTPNLSIIDLIFNLGAEAIDYLL